MTDKMKKDYSAFMKDAIRPPAEETPEEKAQAEKDLQEAIRYTFQLQQQMKATIKTAAEQAAPIIASMQQMKDFAAFMVEWAKKTRQERDAFYDFLEISVGEITEAVDGETAESIADLKEYLFEVWYELQRDPAFREQYADISFPDLLKPEPDEDGEMVTPFRLMLERAKEIRTEYEAQEEKREASKKGVSIIEGVDLNLFNGGTVTEAIEEAEIAAEDIQRIIAREPPERLDYPLDKPNRLLWRLLEEAEGGQIGIDFDTTKQSMKGKGKDAIVYYGLDFSQCNKPGSGITITNRLTPFDKLVYMAAGALFNAGSNVFSIAQLYRMMGYDGRPSDTDRKKIDESLTKMTSRLFIDSTKEAEVNKSYPPFKYDADLLPFERLEVYINNQPTTAIHLFREPPLIAFARGRKQITTISRQLLMPPLSKTSENLSIQDYLIDRISHIKNNKKLSRKLLYKTIFENCNITGSKNKQRAPGKIKKFLDHYVKQGFIKSYKESESQDGITIEI